MTSTTTASPAAWSGWYRATKRGRWVRLTTAGTYDDCLGALLDATRTLAPGELLVSEADPNTPARQLAGKLPGS